jgi:hypothetical protein
MAGMPYVVCSVGGSPTADQLVELVYVTPFDSFYKPGALRAEVAR